MPPKSRQFGFKHLAGAPSVQTKWGRMDAEAPALRRRITPFDFTLITVGGVIGSGIFRNPAVVAQRAHTPFLTMLAWVLGGVLAIIGAFVFAELAARRPQDGGLYAYLKDAFGPGMGFVFVWMDFTLMYTGGTAASAALFAGYVAPAFGITLNGKLVAVIAVACVTLINVLGVRQGATWQNLLVILKVGAIAGLIAAGFVAHPVAAHAALPGFANGAVLAGALGVALLPALFAYQGFQSAAYVTSETIDAARTIPRGLLLGMGIVVAAYLLVNAGCLRVLGAAGLAATATPAADIMTAAVGPWGGRIIAVAIALSTLGYISTRFWSRRVFIMRSRKTACAFRKSDGFIPARACRSSRSCFTEPSPRRSPPPARSRRSSTGRRSRSGRLSLSRPWRSSFSALATGNRRRQPCASPAIHGARSC